MWPPAGVTALYHFTPHGRAARSRHIIYLFLPLLVTNLCFPRQQYAALACVSSLGFELGRFVVIHGRTVQQYAALACLRCPLKDLFDKLVRLSMHKSSSKLKVKVKLKGQSQRSKSTSNHSTSPEDIEPETPKTKNSQAT